MTPIAVKTAGLRNFKAELTHFNFIAPTLMMVVNPR
jgi:hypothetical protein